MEDIENPKAEESEVLAEAYAALNSAHATLDREITEYAAAT